MMGAQDKNEWQQQTPPPPPAKQRRGGGECRDTLQAGVGILSPRYPHYYDHLCPNTQNSLLFVTVQKGTGKLLYYTCSEKYCTVLYKI